MEQDPEEHKIAEWLKIVDKPLKSRERGKKAQDKVIDNNMEQDTEEQRWGANHMLFLLRIFLLLFLVWIACKFIYSHGRKSALNEKNNKHRNHRSIKVDSTVVEKEEDK